MLFAPFAMTHQTRHFVPAWMRRVTAGLSIAIVLALAVFAASPELHAKLHGGTISHGDECPVAVLAAGVSVPVAISVAAPVAVELRVPRALTAEEIFVSSPRYLRQPERGPPGLE